MFNFNTTTVWLNMHYINKIVINFFLIAKIQTTWNFSYIVYILLVYFEFLTLKIIHAMNT